MAQEAGVGVGVGVGETGLHAKASISTIRL
jgi:hypothetical protein